MQLHVHQKGAGDGTNTGEHGGEKQRHRGIAEWKTKRKLGNAAPGLQSAKKLSRFFLLA